MRFRIWCKNKNEWEKDLTMVSPNGVLVQDHYRYGIMSVSSETHILELSTEIIDINGKEIYEGDIVKYTDGKFIRRKGLIEFNCYAFILKEIRGSQIDYLGNIEDMEEMAFEVIGNVFENPYLL